MYLHGKSAYESTTCLDVLTTGLASAGLSLFFLFDVLYIVLTVRRSVCSREKSSKRAAKEFADAVPLRFKLSDQKCGMELCALPSAFLVRRASSKPFTRYPRLQLVTSLQSRQSMRQTLVKGRSDAANTRVARHWYRIRASRLASLQTRAILSTCSCADGVFGSRQSCAV